MYLFTYLPMYLSIYLCTYILIDSFIYPISLFQHNHLKLSHILWIKASQYFQTQKSVLLSIQWLILCTNFIGLRHIASKIFLNMSENTSRKGESAFELVWVKKIYLHKCEQPSSNHARTQIEQKDTGIENSLLLINKT